MFLFIGLGNPGTAYKKTRHNVGFLALEFLATGARWRFNASLKSSVAKFSLWEQDVGVGLQPQTFMNASSAAVLAASAFFHIPPNQWIVFHDDADLPFGDVRVQKNRSSAGHLGVQSIMDALGGKKNFWRVRIGIGRPSDPALDLATWVLEPWSKKETLALPDLFERVKEMIRPIVV